MNSSPPDASKDADRNHHLVRAFLAGLVVASGLFTHVAAVQTPGLDPPPETFAHFLVATALGVVGYSLLDQEPVQGYVVAILTGLFVLVSTGLVVAGVYGSGGPETNPLGPVVYVSLAVAVTVTAWRSMRHRRPTRAARDATPRAR